MVENGDWNLPHFYHSPKIVVDFLETFEQVKIRRSQNDFVVEMFAILAVMISTFNATNVKNSFIRTFATTALRCPRDSFGRFSPPHSKATL